MQNLHLDSELAADLARKINNGEKLSWKEAQEFKYRVSSKMGEIQAYLERESKRAALDSANLDPARGWKNDFSIRLADINKLQASIASKQDFISKIDTTTAHERDDTRQLLREGLAQVSGQTMVSAGPSMPTPVSSPSPTFSGHPGITDQTRTAALNSVTASQESNRNGVEITATAYNVDFKKSHIQPFESALKLLEDKKETSPKLLTALKAFLASGGHTYSNALTLQKEIIVVSKSAKFSDSMGKAKWGPDGFFGPISLAALEQVAGLPATPNATTSGPNPLTPVAGSKPRSKPSAKPTVPDSGSTTPTTSTDLGNPEIASIAGVTGLHNSFKELAKSIDTNWYSATPASRGTDNARLMKAYASLQQAIARLSATEQNSVAIRQIELELAQYFDGGKNNSHHKNPTEALAINLKLLKDLKYLDGSTSKAFAWPTIPTEVDINNALKGTSLLIAWNKQVAAGAEPNAALGYLLGNPKFKGEYEAIHSKVYGEFEDKLSAMLEQARRLNTAGKLAAPSAELLAAMNHAANIMGNGWLTLSSNNLNRAISMAKGAALVLPGAALATSGAGFAWTWAGIGVSAAGVAMVTSGIALATYAGAFARWSNYATQSELALETGVAVLTLVPGVFLYRIAATGAKTAALVQKMGASGLIMADYGANVAIGVSADQMRGLFHGTEVDVSSSFIQNLLFALAPAAGSAMANSARATALATRAQSSLARLGHLQRNGGTSEQVTAAAKEVEAVAAEAAPLRANATQTQWTPSTTSTAQTGEGAAVPKKAPITPNGAEIKWTPSSVNSLKFNDAFARDLSAIPEGQSLNIADISIKREGNSFAVKKWETDAGSFENTAVWRKALAEYVYSNTKPSDIIHAGLSKARMKGLQEVAGKEVIINGQTYKVHQAGDSGIVIQKQVAPGQFKSLSAAEMDGLSSAELVGLTDHIYGPGKAALIEAQLKKSAETQKDMVKKLDKVTVKEFFFGAKTGKDYDLIGAKIPKYMYDWSIGRMARELKVSLVDTPWLRKVEFLRTLVTGRSAWGKGEFISARGWTPGWDMLAKVGAVTVAETYANALIEQNGDFSEAAFWSLAPRNPNSFSKQEFLTNYINYTFVGVLGTALIEAAEVTKLAEEWTIGAAGIVRNILGRIGQDGQPINKN